MLEVSFCVLHEVIIGADGLGDFANLLGVFDVGRLDGHIVEEDVAACLKAIVFKLLFVGFGNFQHFLVEVAHFNERFTAVHVAQTSEEDVCLHIVGLLLNDFSEDFSGFLIIFSLLCFRGVFLLIGCHILRGEEETVGEVSLVAEFLEIGVESFDAERSLLVASIERGEFFVAGKFAAVFCQRFFVETDGSGNVTFFFFQNSRIFVVKIEIEAVGELIVIDISGSFGSSFDCSVVVERFAHFVHLGEEVHAKEHHVFRSQRQDFLGHFQHSVKVCLRIEGLEEVFARANVKVDGVFGNCLVVVLIVAYGILVLVEFVVNVTEVFVSLEISGIQLLDFLQSVDGDVGVHVFINESVALECFHVVGVVGEHGVKHLTGVTPVLHLHANLTAVHEHIDVLGCFFIKHLGIHHGTLNVVLFQEVGTNGEQVVGALSDFFGQFSVSFFCSIGVFHGKFHHVVSHCLILRINRIAFVGSLLCERIIRTEQEQA